MVHENVYHKLLIIFYARLYYPQYKSFEEIYKDIADLREKTNNSCAF